MSSGRARCGRQRPGGCRRRRGRDAGVKGAGAGGDEAGLQGGELADLVGEEIVHMAVFTRLVRLGTGKNSACGGGRQKVIEKTKVNIC